MFASLGTLDAFRATAQSRGSRVAVDALLAMAGDDPTEHLRDMADTLARGHRVLLAHEEGDAAAGFVEASIRNDYVNGTARRLLLQTVER